MKDIHQLAVIAEDPDPKVPIQYVALCGHETTDLTEFRKEKQRAEVLTCQACRVKMGWPNYRCDGGMEK